MDILAGTSATMNKIGVICANVLGGAPFGIVATYRKKFRDQLVYEGLRQAFNSGKNGGTWQKADNPLAYYFRGKLKNAGIGNDPPAGMTADAYRKQISEAAAGAVYAKVVKFTDDQGSVFDDAWDSISDLVAGAAMRTGRRIWDVIKAEASCAANRLDWMALVGALGTDLATTDPAMLATMTYIDALIVSCNVGPEASERVQCKIKAIFDGRACDAPKATPAANRPAPPPPVQPPLVQPPLLQPPPVQPPPAANDWNRTPDPAPVTTGAATAGFSTPTLAAAGVVLVVMVGLMLRATLKG